MLERPAHTGERAILVHLSISSQKADAESLSEFKELALSAGAQAVAVVTGSRESPDPKYYIGSGKAEEIAATVQEMGADLVLFDHALSPSQERNLEELLKCRVLDRAGLILDIFAQRARSFEGKLQVELAQLKHMSTRLVRGWTHLERQQGGIGLRGPGETQLETDRRLIVDRIKQLTKKLEKVREHRALGKRARERAEVPTVSLVGYTNTGKSTLFNALTGATVYAANQLFATLDPTLRKLKTASGQDTNVVLSDTVGFIRHLPHDLIEAFRSTLDETRNADVLLHVIDASLPDRDDYSAQVDAVLAEIGADEVPQIRIYNKIDLTDIPPHVDKSQQGDVRAVWVSARSGAGVDVLRNVIDGFFNGEKRALCVRVPVNSGRTYARMRSLGIIRNESVTKYGDWVLFIDIAQPMLKDLQSDPQYNFELMGDAPIAPSANGS